MEQEERKIPFPQANDFNKIYLLLNIEDERKLKDKNFLMNYVNLGTERQIAYYLSACEFLGLIDKDKNFTLSGKEFRKSSVDLKLLKLCRLIVSLPVFGEVFFMKYLYNEDLSTDDITQLIGAIYGIDNYEVCKRRTSTVLKWIDWIENNKLN